MVSKIVVAIAIDPRAKPKDIRRQLGNDLVDFYIPDFSADTRFFVATLEIEKDKGESFGEFVGRVREFLTEVFDTDKVTLGVL